MSIPNWKLHDVIEKAGAVVVMEEMCTGSRYYSKLVDESPDGSAGNDRRPHRQVPGHQLRLLHPQLRRRIDDVIRLAQEYKVDGIVQYNLQFCAPYQIEATSVERAAQGRRHSAPAHRHRLLHGRHGPALHPGGGLPGDDRRVLNVFLRQNIVGLLRHAAETLPALRRDALELAERLRHEQSAALLAAAALLFEEAAAAGGDAIFVTGSHWAAVALAEASSFPRER